LLVVPVAYVKLAAVEDTVANRRFRAWLRASPLMTRLRPQQIRSE
jgi:hypothetical protein